MRLGFSSTTSLLAVIAAVSAGAALSCGTTSTVGTVTPTVDQVSEYVVRYTGPEIELVTAYGYAQNHLGSEWLILEVAVSGPRGGSVTVERGDISVTAPDGDSYPAAKQSDLNEDWGELRPIIRAANVAQDPMLYFSPNRTRCKLSFYVGPAEGVARSSVTVNDRMACNGKLFFKVPQGVDSGQWILSLDLDEGTVRLPITLK